MDYVHHTVPLQTEYSNGFKFPGEYVGQYYSKEYVRKYILMQSEEDIKLIDTQMAKEKTEGGDEDDFDGEDY